MIFGRSMKKLDHNDVRRSLAVMEDHIRSMQEQLEYTLYNLDSTNVQSLDTALTDIISSSGGISISGESISLLGSGDEKVEMGQKGGRFGLAIAGKGGHNAIWLDSLGRVTIGTAAEIHMDCGRWDAPQEGE